MASRSQRKRTNKKNKTIEQTMEKPLPAVEMPLPAVEMPLTQAQKGVYSEYIDRKMTIEELTKERKHQLQRISELRDGRAILVFAADLKKHPAPVSIDYTDLTPINDQISVLEGKRLDLILETPGGDGVAAEDIIKLLRSQFEELNVIVPGIAKSAGTIMAMAANDILMEPVSALGPIDAQIIHQGKQFSADAFISWLNDIKEEVTRTGVLNKAYLPILQAISPGEIRNAENAMDFAKELVREWLAKYKFKKWTHRARTGEEVTEAERIARANKIADELSNHGKWKTHSKSIKIEDLRAMELMIIDYSEQPELADAIRRYKILLEITFDRSPIYKIYETPTSQIMRVVQQQSVTPGSSIPPQNKIPQGTEELVIDYECGNCKRIHKFQVGLGKSVPFKVGFLKFPTNNIFKCKSCGTEVNLESIRKDIETQSGKKVN